MKIAPIDETNVSRPDCTGLKPNPSCSISGSRNGDAPMPMRNSEPPTTPARNVGELEERQVEQRVRVAALVDNVADRARRGRARALQPRSRRTRDAGRASRSRTSRRQARRPRARSRASRAAAGSRWCRNEAQREDHSERADRHVDEEDPTPIEIGRDETAERRPDHRPDERGNRDPRERLHDLRSSGSVRSSTSRPTGTIIAPPMPCTKRARDERAERAAERARRSSRAGTPRSPT